MIDREVNSVREIEHQTFTIVIDRTAVTEKFKVIRMLTRFVRRQ